MSAPLGWGGVARVGLVQASIGAVVVLTTSLLNRVMVVELGLAASVPGALVALHHMLQMLRPRWGHGSDARARRVPWIVGGIAVLAAGGALASVAVAVMASAFALGVALAVAGFALIGIGAGASGTALLTLLAERTAPERRPAAAATVWIMMIAGFVIATAIAARVLTPFSLDRLVVLGCAVSGAAFLIATAAAIGLDAPSISSSRASSPPFRDALRAVWMDGAARRFAIFVLVSMLAYSAQDLIMEPFAALVFRLPPAATAALTSLQNGGVLAGMVGVALAGRRLGGLRRTTAAGCLLSAAGLCAVALAGTLDDAAALRPAIVSMGIGNGVFAASAIGLMMTLARRSDDAGAGAGAGVRMGVWGAAQAIAFGSGGFLGTLAVDALRLATGETVPAYVAVFLGEAALFVVAATMVAARSDRPAPVLVAAE